MTKIQVIDINDPEFKKRVLEILSKISPKKSNRFVVLPDGWIKDYEIGLDWGPSSDQSMNLTKSKEYCKNLGGRLPTVDEIQTILDRTLYNPVCDKKVFKDIKSEWYWTSTKYAVNLSYNWCVSFSSGAVGIGDEVGNYIRPVRSSQ